MGSLWFLKCCVLQYIKVSDVVVLRFYVNSINTLYFSYFEWNESTVWEEDRGELHNMAYPLVSGRRGAGNTARMVLVVRIISILEQDVVWTCNTTIATLTYYTELAQLLSFHVWRPQCLSLHKTLSRTSLPCWALCWYLVQFWKRNRTSQGRLEESANFRSYFLLYSLPSLTHVCKLPSFVL